VVTIRRAAVWAGAIVLAAGFVAVGALKLGGVSAMRWGERFEQWGYPANAHYAVGVIEITCGLGLLIPRWRRAASLTLAALMVGALGTHVINGEFSRVIPPLILGGLAGLVFWLATSPPPAASDPGNP
jgi:putative oxidoreductase